MQNTANTSAKEKLQNSTIIHKLGGLSNNFTIVLGI